MGLRKDLEHSFKDFFFWATGPLLKRGQSEFRTLDCARLQRVLFLRPEKLGDMIISFPVFDGLKARCPHIKISVLGSPRNAAIINGDPRFDKIFMYTKSAKDLAEIQRIRNEHFDCVVDMICDDSVTALYLSQYTAPGKPRIGVGKVKFREYYDFNYDHRLNNTGHIVDNTLKLLAAFGIDPATVSGYAEPFLTDADRTLAATFIADSTDGSPAPLVVGYNLSAGAPTRVWALEKSIALVQAILARHPEAHVILMVAPPDRVRAQSVASRFDRRVHIVPDNLSLRQASAIVSKVDLLISPDTSMVHIARAFRVPVVGLYSRHQKNFLLWKPYDQEVGSVVSDNDDSIFDITVERVMEVFEQVLTHYVAGKR